MNNNAEQQKRIVLVEDDAELAKLIADFLTRYNFEVTHVSDGREAVGLILEHQPDLVILDVMLPGLNGMEVCQRVRSQFSGMILMQTALDDDADQMRGLEIGADDYVVKQVRPQLLLSRINALLRRSSSLPPRPAADLPTALRLLGPLSLHPQKREARLHRVRLDLTSAEFELLMLLADSAGQVVTRDDLIKQVRGFDYDGLDRSIDRRISRLRKKLNTDAGDSLIKTVRGVGYQLCVEAP